MRLLRKGSFGAWPLLKLGVRQKRTVAVVVTRFALLMALLVATVCIAADEPLELQLVVSQAAGNVCVIASATNVSSSDTTFCGLWGFEIVYIPNSETAVRIARRDSIAHTVVYDRWEGVQAPHIIDIGRLLGPEHWVTLLPRTAYSDTVMFALGSDSYREWPGVLEVRYYLDLCEAEQAVRDNIPRNGQGGTLIARIPVPPGGV